MSDTHTHSSDFETVINRSFVLAVQLQHEYVTQEHVLYACLENVVFDQLLQRMQVPVDVLKQKVWQFLNDATKHSMVSDVSFQPKYTHVVLTVVKQAKAQSLFMGRIQILVQDLVLAMFNTRDSWAVYLLQSEGVTKASLQEQIVKHTHDSDHVLDEEQARLTLSSYAHDLNKKARNNKTDPLIGRQSDVDQIVHVLSRKNKHNVLLVGAPGVGKTQIVEGLAKLIVEKKTPEQLWDKEIWSLDVSALVAGTKFRGDFEERMKQVIQALQSLPDVVVFIDEIHMILGAGSGGGQSAMDVANILKPALSRGEIKCIGATTSEEFRKYFEKDRALLRRFHKQDVQEPSVSDTKLIVKGVLSGFSKFHSVKYAPECVDVAVDLAVKHIHNKHLPDKALDVIDHAGTIVKLAGLDQVTVNHVQQSVSDLAQISLDVIQQQHTTRTHELHERIKQKLFGQDHAVHQITDQVYMSLSGLRENTKCMGSFLLVGPSGVGKTEMAKLLAQELNYAFVRFDMSEFQEKHSVSRLIGSPPGYVGYADGAAGSGALITALESNPQCVLLIDEVEKAHPDVSQIFLQAMDAGQITSANQKTVHMNNCVLIFTSNLGAQDLDRNPLGFGMHDQSSADSDAHAPAVKQFFAPEFRNRLDAVINFHKLSKSHMQHILHKFLEELNTQCALKHVTVTVDPQAQAWLIEHGFDPVMGARPLGRCVAEHIKKPMSKQILFGKLQHGGRVLVSVGDDHKIKLDFMSLPENLGHQMISDHVHEDVTPC